jgi:hypothetical protein
MVDCVPSLLGADARTAKEMEWARKTHVYEVNLTLLVDRQGLSHADSSELVQGYTAGGVDVDDLRLASVGVYTSTVIVLEKLEEDFDQHME